MSEIMKVCGLLYCTPVPSLDRAFAVFNRILGCLSNSLLDNSLNDLALCGPKSAYDMLQGLEKASYSSQVRLKLQYTEMLADVVCVAMALSERERDFLFGMVPLCAW